MAASESGERGATKVISKNTPLTLGIVTLIVVIAIFAKGVADNSESLTKIVQDHEVRIRDLEKKKP